MNNASQLIERLHNNHITWRDTINRCEEAATRITELEAQLADAKQVANDCRIVADNAIAEALQSKELIKQLVEAFKQDRIEWEDFPPSSLLAFSKLITAIQAEGKA